MSRPKLIFSDWFLPTVLITVILSNLVLYWWTNTSRYLEFSDGVKFADVARNMVDLSAYGSSFKFFAGLRHDTLASFPFSASGILPGMPFIMYLFFVIFGVSDHSVILSSIALFAVSLILLYKVGEKVYGKATAVFAMLLVGLNISLVEFSLNGASEVLLIFQIVFAVYLISFKKNTFRIFAALVVASIYFTRFNSVIYIFSILFYWLTVEFGFKKGIGRLLWFAVCFVFIDLLVFRYLEGRNYFYSIFSGANIGIVGIAPGLESDYLRLPALGQFSLANMVSKVIYNLYNFYKFIPQILSPYIFTFFLLGILVRSKNIEERNLKLLAVVLFASSVIVYSFTIPFFRYIRPTIPVVYLVSLGALSNMLRKIEGRKLIYAGFVTFVLLSSFGTIFLDSRFERKNKNTGRPPVYVQLSWILKENTGHDDVIVTNLDTWGSWYGERKTVWFPLEPKQLKGFTGKIDAIYLTSYLMDDENYYMGEAWRQVFLNPDNPEDEFIANNYRLKEVFSISSEEVYEKEDARAVLLVRK